MMVEQPRASEIAEPNSVVRMVGYEPQPGISDEQFIAAWHSAVAAVPQPTGLVYRELSRQVPEWNARIAGEIQHPNPFAFIDYSIVRADSDPAALPTLSTDITAQYKTSEGSYQIAYRFTPRDPRGEPTMLLYNLFQTDGSRAAEQGLTMSWPTRAAFQAQQTGFFSAMFHRRTASTVPIAAFNRGEWSNAADYANTTAALDRQFPVQGRSGGSESASGLEKPPLSSFLGLFQIVATVTPAVVQPRQIMKAVRFHAYGGPEVLQYEDAVRPLVGAGQILIRVRAVGVNPLDTKIRIGEMKTMNPAWFPDILGYDIAGVVEAVGAGVQAPPIGAEVYGTNTPGVRRGYAEYAVAAAPLFLPKPKNLDFIQAATVPSVASTANNALFAMAKLQAGQTILIHGGSGSVGTFAVQFAKQAGAHVVATASAANLEYVRSLGADEVLDYRTQRFEEHVSAIDVVLDTMGGDTRARSWKVLRRGGVLVTLVPPLPDQSLAAQYGVRAMMNQNQGDSGGFFAHLTELIEQGNLMTPQIGAVLPLSEAAGAHALLAQGSAHGRIVLTVP